MLVVIYWLIMINTYYNGYFYRCITFMLKNSLTYKIWLSFVGLFLLSACNRKALEKAMETKMPEAYAIQCTNSLQTILHWDSSRHHFALDNSLDSWDTLQAIVMPRLNFEHFTEAFQTEEWVKTLRTQVYEPLYGGTIEFETYRLTQPQSFPGTLTIADFNKTKACMPSKVFLWCPLAQHIVDTLIREGALSKPQLTSPSQRHWYYHLKITPEISTYLVANGLSEYAEILLYYIKWVCYVSILPNNDSNKTNEQTDSGESDSDEEADRETIEDIQVSNDIQNINSMANLAAVTSNARFFIFSTNNGRILNELMNPSAFKFSDSPEYNYDSSNNDHPITPYPITNNFTWYQLSWWWRIANPEAVFAVNYPYSTQLTNYNKSLELRDAYISRLGKELKSLQSAFDDYSLECPDDLNTLTIIFDQIQINSNLIADLKALEIIKPTESTESTESCFILTQSSNQAMLQYSWKEWCDWVFNAQIFSTDGRVRKVDNIIPPYNLTNIVGNIPGTYFVNIFDSNGYAVFSGKFIKI